MNERSHSGPGWGEAVRRLREERGWTQGQLAYRAGVDQSQISKIESGAQEDARLSTVTRLADALGVGVDALLGRRSVAGADPLADRVADAVRKVLAAERDGQPGQDRGKPTRRGTGSTESKDEARRAHRPTWGGRDGLVAAAG